MKYLIVVALAIFFCAATSNAQPSAAKLWDELKKKREALPTLRQEFEVSRTFKLVHDEQSSKWHMILDMSHGQWREKNIWGSSTRLRIFDGQELFSFEEGGDEFMRIHHRPKDDVPSPSLFGSGDLEWQKAVEVARNPCGFSGKDQICAIIDAPLRSSATIDTHAGRVFSHGKERFAISMDTGLVVSATSVTSVERERSPYTSQTTYTLKGSSYIAQPDVSLFKVPEGMHEVKELSKWNAAKIRKQLAGKPAPELAVTDIQGKQVTLASLKGKTVLLDFWATWCEACRADGPALDKLYAKYGDQNLEIIAISLSEDRGIVEKFLKEHRHTYPIVLTSENEMPLPFQIDLLPTYIVIGKDGNVAGAVEGDQGFSDLRKTLKKAGMEVD
jgi:thiol-disulfide isomerase/thioredoxin